MSDIEYERFEITDYDLDNEFNINRPRRRQTKNQQIYGIWADDSDNDSADEGTNSRRGRRGRAGLGASSSKMQKDYSAPVSFVAGGIQQSGKKQKKKAAMDEEAKTPITDEDEDEDESEERPAFGRKQPQLVGRDSSDESSAPEEEEEPRSSKASKAFAHKSQASVSNRNVGAWEQHTRGIGAKLLLQMGYEPGKGLGKDLQGISQPVEAHVRKGRGAIGAYGPEKATSVPKKAVKPKEDDDVRETKEFKEQLNKWKKSGQDRTKRYYYKSVEEVIEKGKKSNVRMPDKISKKLSNVPVIDMTGPEKRIFSGYHALGQSKIFDEDLYEQDAGKKSTTSGADSSAFFALPELLHNLELIVDMCEQEIISLDKTEREATDKQGVLEHERHSLEEIVDLEKKHIDTLESALELVEELSEGLEELTLSRAEQIFLELQSDYAAEYKEFALGDLAAGIIAPLMKNTLVDWQPLQEPTKQVDLVKKWRTILFDHSSEANSSSETRNIFDPYSSLIWAGVIPSFRACAATWNPKHHQTMAALLDCWAPLFPTWILDSVLEQLVLPRLSSGVKEWDPLTDTVPIHMWILPWNNILGHKLEDFVFPTIREKLGAALQGWMPQDRSARAMLTPWKGAFDEEQMEIFLLQHIIPKLQLVLNEFIINPLQQDLELWNQVWEWYQVIPSALMAQILDKYFFPKWMQVLVMWLNQSPDFAEISRWYNGWKNILSEDVLREPSVKLHMRRGLEMMHRATDTPIPAMPASPPPPPMPPSLLELQLAAPVQLEFKDLVSQKCAEAGIIFAPIPGRRELGKQIYRVGKLYCYIDRSVCIFSESGQKGWAPISLLQLLERASTVV